MDNTLPTIDWDLGKKLAGNDLALAKDILAMLIKNMPNDMTKINQLCAKQNYAELKQQIHTLRGAVVYCGTPRLKAVLAALDKQLKSPIKDKLADLLQQLRTEVSNLNKAYRYAIN
jgi:HPt (histidine-containing phosphotransfer) domain-containing protein